MDELALHRMMLSHLQGAVSLVLVDKTLIFYTRLATFETNHYQGKNGICELESLYIILLICDKKDQQLQAAEQVKLWIESFPHS